MCNNSPAEATIPENGGPQASHLYSAVGVNAMPRRVGGRVGHDAAFGASLGETASSADFGGSIKYSNVNFEDRSGERFHVNVNSSSTWVS